MLVHEAEQFITIMYDELNRSDEEKAQRLEEVASDIKATGTYELTEEELTYGAKLAWRNSNRCIGRLFWQSLHVFDHRHVRTRGEVKEALLSHIAFATNEGRIRPVISVFPEQGVRIWNHQLIRYAGYETTDGVIGDPDSIAFTNECRKLGWEPRFGAFDVLPIVFQIDGEEPTWFDVPPELVVEVDLEHPTFSWFTDLALKWYAVPIISSMKLEIGGIEFPAAPFNGWYMGTEIGARNFADEARYNMLPVIGERMGLDVTKLASLWRDRALVELNEAVLYSYKKAGVSIVDHHTAAQQFKKFEEIEQDHGREITGYWPWLIPPMSPATTHIFHQSYKDEVKKPNFFYQEEHYQK
ncbi:nitric-oxide synthase [Fictibacillus macauensis ZFHKF-1]|uniref:Nitric oxide synthase oxygenase n=1 Tax=Fictibacillus macauensis ZFHKF-1 TaxID=1196324 RepID=I8AFB9_9BACL|nr:nitric oxide synthase oxygenase [Fictibacillus macauensis]EIT84327.1 nitric-oxide synthase [Fictibacillus macauensis ZFHKF-1]